MRCRASVGMGTKERVTRILLVDDSEALRKSLDKGLFIRRSPFDKLRANGSGMVFVGFLPFVLSLSKHGFANCRVVWQFPESLLLMCL